MLTCTMNWSLSQPELKFNIDSAGFFTPWLVIRLVSSPFYLVFADETLNATPLGPIMVLNCLLPTRREGSSHLWLRDQHKLSRQNPEINQISFWWFACSYIRRTYNIIFINLLHYICCSLELDLLGLKWFWTNYLRYAQIVYCLYLLTQRC
jgi:hypothetical protein